MRIPVRIGSALLLGVGIVVAAYFLRPDPVITQDELAAAIVTIDPRPYQPEKDTDADGVPDWQEEADGTNPLVKDTSTTTRPTRATTTRDTTVPDTATSRFAQRFFGEMIQRGAEGNPMSDDEKQRFLERSLKEMAVLGYDKPRTVLDITLSAASSTEAIRDYGNAVAIALTANPVETEMSILIFKRAVESGNDKELEALDPLIESYRGTISQMRAIPVPRQFANEHVELLNRLQNLHNTIVAFRNMPADPLPALVRVRQYFDMVDALGNAIDAIYAGVTTAGVTYTSAEPGYALYQIHQFVGEVMQTRP